MAAQFEGIFRGLSPDMGKLRLANSGLAWRGDDSEFKVAAGDIKWAQWLRVARNYQLRIGLKDHARETLDGFMREDHDKIAALFKQHFGVTLESKEVSVKGWNWGMTDFQGNDLAFLVSNKTSFELPLHNVSNSNIAGRTEVSLEFTNPPSEKKGKRADEMVEIRFYVPGTRTRERGSDAGSPKPDGEDADADADADAEEISAAQAFHDAIKEKAELGQVAGNLILSFEEVLVLTPRGRYDVDMFPDFLRLRGKTYDYKILYSSISSLFLLPKDDAHVLFIIALSTPIRQGQTRYQFLVTQFTRSEEMTAELNMDEEELAKHDKLKKNYEDPTFEVVSSVFRALAGHRIVGTGSFTSRAGTSGVKANQKAVQGDLFVLERFLFFVSKQPTLVEFGDIHQVVFSRLGSGMGATAARTFDLKVVTKSGPEYTFTSINKEEHEPLEAYLKGKKLRVKNEMMQDVDMTTAVVDDDDDDMQSVASDEDEAPRPRAGAGGAGADDEDSEEDEDFRASDSDAGSPSSASDSDDDGAQTASDDSGDRDIAKSTKKKKALTKKKAKADGEEGAKPKKKAKPKAKDGDDAMDVDVDVDGEDAPKAKAKPKPRPKPAAKAAGEDDGPAKKKRKTSEE